MVAEPRCTPRIRLLLAASLFALGSPAGSLAVAAITDYQYLCPVPASQLVRAENNVIVRFGPAINPATVTQERLAVTGSLSGDHTGVLVLSDDGRTLIFEPDTPFSPGDSVTVKLRNGIKTVANDRLPQLEFFFHVSPQTLMSGPRGLDAIASEFPKMDVVAGLRAPRQPAPISTGCALPADYLPVTVLSSNAPEAGAIFLDPFSIAGGFGQSGTLCIVDNLANPMFWRRLPDRAARGFQLMRNGLPRLHRRPCCVRDGQHLHGRRQLRTGNGYVLDGHDSQLLPNGHILLMSYDPQPVRMDSIVRGRAIRTRRSQGLVIQELDLARRVVFQWRSWDAIPHHRLYFVGRGPDRGPTSTTCTATRSNWITTATS